MEMQWNIRSGLCSPQTYLFIGDTRQRDQKRNPI